MNESESRENAIAAHIGLVHSCARRFIGRGLEYEDLFQAGCLGLVKAYDAFDRTRGVMFSTYAVPVILGEMRRLFREGGTVKVGRTLKELSMRVTRERERFCEETGREPGLAELAERVQADAAEVAEALCVAVPPLSLTQEDENGEPIELNIGVDSQEEALTDRLALRQALSRLPERDRKLVLLRYFEGKTQVQTAEILGMTQVQVSRREKSILLTLRERMAG